MSRLRAAAYLSIGWLLLLACGIMLAVAIDALANAVGWGAR